MDRVLELIVNKLEFKNLTGNQIFIIIISILILGIIFYITNRKQRKIEIDVKDVEDSKLANITTEADDIKIKIKAGNIKGSSIGNVTSK